MKILFVCKYNRFRSKVAEAVFSKLDKSRKCEIKSAGARIDFMNQYVAGSVINLLAKKDYKINDEKSHLINKHMIDWADRIIIVADNISPSDFPKDKTEIWKIEDAHENEPEKIEDIIEQIETRVKNLAKTLKI